MLTLTRTDNRPDGIFGKLTRDTGEQVAVTLEHAYLVDGSWQPKLPVGTYTCVWYRSPHFGYDVFLIMNVPGHDHIEIHCGCFDDNSDGCVLLGEKIAPYGKVEMITNSRATFKAFMDSMNGIDTFQITVV